MTLAIDLYYTMRSPYCYLATPTLAKWVKQYQLQVNLKIVYPLAVSDPTFFSKVNPLWPPYVAKDTQRIANRLNIPFRWPRPDPIVQDPETRAVAAEQPHIRELTRLAQLAADQGRGLDYVCTVSALLYNPQVSGWNTGSHLADALAHLGLDLQQMRDHIASNTEQLDSKIAQNRAQQLEAGHWGAPLMVHNGEQFFGQDRLDDLLWYLQQQGLQER